MAIAEMRKLNLVAMSYDKDAILNALQRTCAVEIVSHAAAENAVVSEYETEGLKAKVSSVEAALSALCTETENYEKEHAMKSDVLKDGFDVSYSEFMAAKDDEARVSATLERINALTDEKNSLKAELVKCARSIGQAEIYATVNEPFSAFADTRHARVRLGTVASTGAEALKAALFETELCDVKTLNATGDEALLLVVSHKSVAAETEGALSSFGFTACPYGGETTGAEVYANALRRKEELLAALKKNVFETYEMRSEIRPLKIYCDRLSFELEKAETGEKLRTTERTFLLQAYVPKEAEATVENELKGTGKTTFFEFFDPAEEDEPPTLLKNNAVVSNFESITNTYSTPNYREFDPNAVMAFFYSLFMGFIIGDAGYGLLMTLVGGWLWWKNRGRPTGTSRLAGAFAIGGLFAILWGALFNSLFGFAIFSKTVMPNPQTDMWSLAGIAVPSVLVISMVLGVFQLFAGYICRAWQQWRRGDIIGGICDGVIWAFFSVGVGLAVVGFVEEANVPILGTVGGITAGVSLALAMLTAGRKEKLFGKFTKGFGAAYGVINYASDILSYARLYGLMLSGAVIGQIIATYAGGFIVSGRVPMIVLGVVLLIVGHGFNLVMNLLGAYIHDARLQYVEFYGRFFEGEGELFTPLGSKRKYVYLLPANAEK
ncbi:MAG: V-type ATP synthase subunit I [Clostridia bacterium]|nr:V-type ATP synthase subunit I [Clostridia bacterium]